MARALDPVPDRITNVLPRLWREIRAFLGISWRLGIRDREASRPYWKTLVDCLRHNPAAFRAVVSSAALYLHLRPFAGFMDARLKEQIEAVPQSDVRPALQLTREMKG
jgi:hypothetical protein